MSDKPQVCFSHGRESGPWGRKIKALSGVAKDLGFEVSSLDYRGITDPDKRVEKLVDYCGAITSPLILTGSSMGGYVAAVGSGTISADGLFLMAPALFLPGYRVQAYHPRTSHVAIVHGWSDELIPPGNSFRFAEQTGGTLHLLKADHALSSVIPEIGEYFAMFLKQAGCFD